MASATLRRGIRLIAGSVVWSALFMVSASENTVASHAACLLMCCVVMPIRGDSITCTVILAILSALNEFWVVHDGGKTEFELNVHKIASVTLQSSALIIIGSELRVADRLVLIAQSATYAAVRIIFCVMRLQPGLFLVFFSVLLFVAMATVLACDWWDDKFAAGSPPYESMDPEDREETKEDTTSGNNTKALIGASVFITAWGLTVWPADAESYSPMLFDVSVTIAVSVGTAISTVDMPFAARRLIVILRIAFAISAVAAYKIVEIANLIQILMFHAFMLTHGIALEPTREITAAVLSLACFFISYVVTD
jgi:hypothetical protein